MTDVPPPHPQVTGVPADDEIPDLLTVPEGALYSARLPMAMAYAAVLHSPQTRKDDRGTPYITHPLTVAGNVWHYGLGVPVYESEMEDLVIAAVLHDIVEDTGGDNRLREIQSMFGSRVAQLVNAATDSSVEDPATKPPWRDRKEQHIARVRQLAAPAGDPPAGIAIASLAERPDLREAAYRLAVEVYAALPDPEPVSAGDFEEWRLRDVDVPNAPLDGYLLALAGDDPVGYCRLYVHDRGRSVGHLMTGVTAAWRGRGVASALKRAALGWALAHGAERMTTENAQGNEPMLAINRGFGYRPTPDFVEMDGPVAPV